MPKGFILPLGHRSIGINRIGLGFRPLHLKIARERGDAPGGCSITHRARLRLLVGLL